MIFLAGAKDFSEVVGRLRKAMRTAGQVENERWQGVDVSKDPAARMYELRNVTFEVDLRGIEDLDHWRKDVEPNLPWADDHFLERVGGTVLNPGEEWKNWPWGKSAGRFRSTCKEELGPRMAPQDWAYLAGILDGDGCISYRLVGKNDSLQGRIYVSQKDRKVLDYLHETFKVGNVVPTTPRDQVLNGKVHSNQMFEWQIGSILESYWILDGCLPYLRVKQDKAGSVIRMIQKSLSVPKISTAPIKKVWGKDWPARFNHTYADRLWPNQLEGGSVMKGHNWSYGNLQDVVELLVKEPSTRQAWIPLFFPEDTGYGDGGRKPCTLGYQFLVRQDRIHIWYPLRSCDLAHHFQDDCYLAVRLLLWVLEQCRSYDRGRWGVISPGTYAMHMTSLHVFENDRKDL